jgi:hypothetical protein
MLGPKLPEAVGRIVANGAKSCLFESEGLADKGLSNMDQSSAHCFLDLARQAGVSPCG